MTHARPDRLTRIVGAWFALAWALAGGTLCFGQAAPVWKTGPALRKQLEASVSLAWEERPLREGLVSLSHSTGVCIFLDRRIDPDQLIDLTASDQPLELLLEELAAKMDARIGNIGPIVYLGPNETAVKLSTLASRHREKLASAPADIKARLLRSQAWRWDELAEPRNLAAELAQAGNLTIVNPEALPHDLWPAVDLPPMAWVDRLGLVLAGFGLTYEFERGGLVRLVTIPEEVLVEKRYTPRGEAAAFAVQLRNIVPDAKVRVEGNTLLVAAVQDDHDKIQRLLSGQSVRTTSKSAPEKRYSMTVENQPVGSVVTTVARQLGKEMKYDPSLVEKLQTQISFTVKDATLDELLAKALSPLKLGYRIDDAAVEVIPVE